MKFANQIIVYKLLFITIPLMILLSFYNIKKLQKLRKIWGISKKEKLNKKIRTLIFLKKIILLIAITCLILAMLRPQLGTKLIKKHNIGTTIIFAIDTSRSMLANDVRPNRIELAKMSIFSILDKIKCNRLGLIAFAGSAFLQCPPTPDIDAFKTSLEAIDTNIIMHGGTNIESAMELSMKLLSSDKQAKQLVLLSDGESLSGNAIKVAKTLKKNGIVVHTVGVGTNNGSAISIINSHGETKYVKDMHGKTVISVLDEASLQEIAKITNGMYTRLDNIIVGLQKIYASVLKNLPKENFESFEEVPIERFQYFLLPALLLFLFEPLLCVFISKKTIKL